MKEKIFLLIFQMFNFAQARGQLIKVVPAQMLCIQSGAYKRASTTEEGKTRVVPTVTMRKGFEKDGHVQFLPGDSRGMSMEIPNDINRFLFYTLVQIIKAAISCVERDAKKFGGDYR